MISSYLESLRKASQSRALDFQPFHRFSAKGHATPRLLAKLSVIRHFTERHEDAPSRPLHGPGSMSVIAPSVSEIRAKPSDTFCLLLLLLESTSGRFYIGDSRLKNKSTNLLKVTSRHPSSQTLRQQLQRHLEPHLTTTTTTWLTPSTPLQQPCQACDFPTKSRNCLPSTKRTSTCG